MPGSSLARELNELLKGKRSHRAPVRLSMGFLPAVEAVVSWRLPNLSRLHEQQQVGVRLQRLWSPRWIAGAWRFVLWMIGQCTPESRLTHPARNGSEPPTHPRVMCLCRSSNLLHLYQLPTVEGMICQTFEHHSRLWVSTLPLPVIKQEFNTRAWVIGTPVPPSPFKKPVPNLQPEQPSLLEQQFGPIRVPCQSDMLWVHAVVPWDLLFSNCS